MQFSLLAPSFFLFPFCPVSSSPTNLTTTTTIADLSKRIIGGLPVTQISEFPFIGILVSNGKQCGCTILSPTKVITAAHCVNKRKKEDMTLYFGSLTPYHPTATRGSFQEREVAYFDVPRKFNPDTTDWDVAMLTLKDPLDFDDNVNAATLVSEHGGLQHGDEVVVAGWGVTSNRDTRPADYLQATTLNIVAWGTCRREWQVDGEISVREGCALAPGRDACIGDSGGPVLDKNDNLRLIGGNTYGPPGHCAHPTKPGVFADYSHPDINQWIRKKLKKTCQSTACTSGSTGNQHWWGLSRSALPKATLTLLIGFRYEEGEEGKVKGARVRAKLNTGWPRVWIT